MHFLVNHQADNPSYLLHLNFFFFTKVHWDVLLNIQEIIMIISESLLMTEGLVIIQKDNYEYNYHSTF